MAANAILTVIKEGETIKSCPVEGDVLLGRAEGCTIRLDDRAISRQHAVFRYAAGQVQVEKKSEFAPLSVNGVECTRAVLKEGDVVIVGPYQVRLSQIKAAVPSNLDVPVGQAAPGVPVAETAPSPDQGEALPLDGLPDSNNEGELGAFPSDGNDNPELASEQNDEPGFDASPQFDSSPSPNASAPSDFAATDDAKLQEEAPDPVDSEPIDEDGKTKLTPAAKLSVKLIFKPGTANHTEYELTKDEISIGRGKNCDIVLEDKKASRKNSIIRRAGLNFMIKDLDSANGTFVNGVKIKEQELTGDDTIMVGNVQFQFKAISSDYVSREKDFMSLPPEPELGFGDEFASQEVVPQDQNPMAQGMEAGALSPNAGVPTGEIGNIPGITGLPGAGTQKKDLIAKFKALPRRTQVIWLVTIGVFLIWYFSEDEVPMVKKGTAKKTAAATAPTGDKGPVTFERLSPEQKSFIKTQYDLAFNYFKNHDYDKSIYEVNKIFDLIPDYENAREIKRYAEEGKQRLQAIEEERAKKEEEAKLKAKIAQLEDETRKHMESKEYDQAKELFTQILAIDPDNATIPPWRKQIEAYEDQLKIQAQQKQVQEEINKQGLMFLNEGKSLKKEKRYYPAIEAFQKVIDIGTSDKGLISAAKQLIAGVHSTIRRARDPVLKEAKTLEQSGDFVKSFNLYKKATRIDPPHPAGYAGMNRIKGILHDRAKSIYTEAVLAESYSDFENAKKLYQECIEVAPQDDIYHERAERKLAHYFRKEEARPQ